MKNAQIACDNETFLVKRKEQLEQLAKAPPKRLCLLKEVIVVKRGRTSELLFWEKFRVAIKTEMTNSGGDKRGNYRIMR